MSLPDDWIRHAGQVLASDLSFEPQVDGTLAVVERLEGIRSQVGSVSAAESKSAIARLKSLAGLPAYITQEPQDGRIDGRPLGIPGELRAAFLPTVQGERCALRLPALGDLPLPEQLGFPLDFLQRLHSILSAPDGLVVVTGPTGSGKTTTIHSLLNQQVKERPDRHIVTLEDPVERHLAGLTQVEINTARGLDFVEALRAAMRHDPDVLVVGEIRDAATAQAALRAALTGHLVITTVHAGRAIEVIPRLLDMGLPPEHLFPALRAVVAQRLVRLLHSDCQGKGCDSCHSGWKGRQVIADLLVFDEQNRHKQRQGLPLILEHNLETQAANLVATRQSTEAERNRVIPR